MDTVMVWVRVDDSFDEHPKFAKAGPLGIALWLAGMAYCNRNLTDGFIPWSVARRLVSWDFLGPERKIYSVGVTCGIEGEDVESDFVITLLINAGLWAQADGGYQVHDYPDYQPTKAQVEAERAQKVAAGQAGGLAAARARATANGVAPAVAEPEAAALAKVKPRTRTRSGTSSNEEGAEKPSKPNRSAEVIDALRARGIEPTMRAQDHAALKASTANVEEIADVYEVIFAGKYGDPYMQRNLTIQHAIGWIDGYRSWRKNGAPRAAARPEPARKLIDRTGVEN